MNKLKFINNNFDWFGCYRKHNFITIYELKNTSIEDLFKLAKSQSDNRKINNVQKDLFNAQAKCLEVTMEFEDNNYVIKQLEEAAKMVGKARYALENLKL